MLKIAWFRLVVSSGFSLSRKILKLLLRVLRCHTQEDEIVNSIRSTSRDATMTLASDTKKNSPNRFRANEPSHGERSDSEAMPPTLLRLPQLKSAVAEEKERPIEVENECQPLPKVSSSGPRGIPIGAHTVSDRVVAAATTKNPESPDGSTHPPRPRLAERVGLKDFNAAAWIDRIATRKTLSAALVVVAGIAIWAPRPGESNRHTGPSSMPESLEAEVADPLLTSTSQFEIAARTPAYETPEHGAEHALLSRRAETAMEREGSQTGLLNKTAQTTPAPVEHVSHETSDDQYQNAGYDMDPLASAANEQIRRMDATYADLPSMPVAETAAAESADLTPDIENEPLGGLSSLSQSRTPNPIKNWADYLPPVGAVDFAERGESHADGPPAEFAAGQAGVVAGEAMSVPTTDTPIAPDAHFGLPGNDELIDADEHIAMPPMDAVDRAQTR